MDLDKLQAETEKLLSLLKSRQPGLLTWHMFLQERLRAVVALAQSAGITTREGDVTHLSEPVFEPAQNGPWTSERNAGWKSALAHVDLSPAQLQVLDEPPVWKLNPPQRGEYETTESYIQGILDYTNRVLAARRNRTANNEYYPHNNALA